MTTQQTAVTVRHPVMADARRTLDLIDRCEIAEYDETDSDLAELTHDWEQIDLSKDAWLVFNAEDVLVGYAAVLPHGDGVRYTFFDDPEWPDGSLGRALLIQCDARGLVMAAEKQQPLEVTIYLAAVNERNKGAAETAEFTLVRHHFQMWIDLAGPIAQPQWPEGVTVRTADPDQDAKAIHKLIVNAFSWGDKDPVSFEEWQGSMMRPDIFDPELWFLAEYNDKVVGASLTFSFPEGGWVRQLAVYKNWQGRGIGAALLRHSFLAFKDLGHEKVGLGVRADNEHAVEFYEQLGMKRARQYDEYRKVVGE